MRIITIIGLLLIIAVYGQCRQDKKLKEIINEISDVTWYHSYEDDKDDMMAYRPENYDFPPARGREGFRFNKDGSFLLMAIAPADGHEQQKGKWTIKDDKTVQVRFDDRQIGLILLYELGDYKDNIIFFKKKYE